MANANDQNQPNPLDKFNVDKNDSNDRHRGNADKERREVSEKKERLIYDFKEMSSSAEALLRSTANYTGAEIQEARERLQAQLDAARERSSEMQQSVQDATQRLAARTDECVHKHPWTCIGIAFIVGMGTAHCMRRH